MKKIGLTGKVFGRLTVIGEAAQMHGRPAWLCSCACGANKVVAGGHLRLGATTSCGCLRKERATIANTSHGGSNSREYSVWCNMQARCNNPNASKYKYYGGRGIKVCERWGDFSLFIADMGNAYVGHSIERLDPDGDYEPANCVWADKYQQARNHRVRRESSTGIRGVYPAGNGRYRANIMTNGVTVGLGHFKTIEEASAARKAAEQDLRLRSLSDTSMT